MPPNGLPHAPSDTHAVRDAKYYVTDKLGVLNAYLWGFSTACNGRGTGRPMPWWYIDGSSGPGVNVVTTTGERLAGSPLIAMAVNAPPQNPPAAGLVFADKSRSATRALTIRTAHDPRVRVIQGDVHSDPQQVLTGVPRNLPTVAFFDPTGLECEWTTLEYFARWKRSSTKIELLVMLPLWVGMLRTLFRKGDTPEAHLRKWDRMFGPSDWRSWYDQYRTLAPTDDLSDAIDELTGIYQQGFKDHLGYAHVQRRRVPDHGPPRYWLIFATDHKAGKNIMNGAMNRLYGPEQTLFPTDPEPYR